MLLSLHPGFESGLTFLAPQESLRHRPAATENGGPAVETAPATAAVGTTSDVKKDK